MNRPTSCFDRRLHQVDAADGVVAQVHERLAHALRHQSVRREVHDAVKRAGFGEDAAIASASRRSPSTKRASFGYGAAVALGKVVEDHDLVAGLDQFIGADGADVAGAAGDEDFHEGVRD